MTSAMRRADSLVAKSQGIDHGVERRGKVGERTRMDPDHLAGTGADRGDATPHSSPFRVTARAFRRAGPDFAPGFGPNPSRHSRSHGPARNPSFFR